MPQDAGKFTDAPAVAKDGGDLGNFDIGGAAEEFSKQAFEKPLTAEGQNEALMSVNAMGAGDTGFDFADAGMSAATELIPDTGDIANTGKLEFGGKEAPGKESAADKGDAKGEAATSDGAQEKNMMGTAAFMMSDMGKGPSEEAKQAADNFIFNGDNWFENHNKKN